MKQSSVIPDKYEDLKDVYIEQASELHSLKQELSWLKKQVFGTKSEKLHPDPGQLTLDGLGSPGGTGPEEDAVPVSVNRARPGKKKLPKNLPRIRIIHIPDEVKDIEHHFIKIGIDVNEELNFIPARMEVIEHVYPKFKHIKEGWIIQATAVSRPIAKGRPGAGLLAHVAVSKYADHLPLDRLVKIFKRLDIDIPKSTMVHWIKLCRDNLLPVYEKMKEQILSGDYVLSDDTSIQVLDKSKKGKSPGVCTIRSGCT